MLNVAIAVDSTTDYGPDAVRVVAAACEEVIGEARCPVASDLAPGAVAAWYAVVHPEDGALSSVRIEFRDRAADGVLIEQRALTFRSADSLRSRLASVGSVIAALAAAREGSIVDPPRPRSPVPEEPPPASNVERPNWTVGVAALGSPTFGGGPARFGALAEVQIGLGDRPFLLFGARYAEHEGEPHFVWYIGSAGLGTRVFDRAASFNLELTGALIFEHTTLSADRGTEHDSAEQNGWGARLGVAAVWAAWRHWAITLAADGTLVIPRINVVVGQAQAVSIPFTTLGLSVGLRIIP